MDLRGFYESINADVIHRFIAESHEENLHLDFKRVGDSEMSSRDDRKNLARSLSGFANSDGGVIIWGIDARRRADGVDCACGEVQLSSLSSFLSRLNELTGECVNPVVDGVLHRKIPVAGDNGFAATLVPATDRGPHMAKGGEDRYYKRSGSRFVRMEHFDVEDMFGKRKRPHLELTRRVFPAALLGEFRVVLGLANTGRGSARAPYLGVKVGDPYKVSRFGIDGNSRVGLPQLAEAMDSSWDRYGSMGSFVLHPGVALDVTAIVGRREASPAAPRDLVVDYEIACEDFPAVSGRLEIPCAEVFLPG